MTQFDEQLQKAFDELADIAPHRPGLAEAVRRRSRYRRAAAVAPAVVAVLVLALIGGLFVFRPDIGDDPAEPASSACSPVRTEVLPDWARAGFSDPEPRMPVVHSRSGAMLAILFASPLSSPEGPGGANKILWVTQLPAAPGESLVLTGNLEGGSALSQTSVDGGPGPSYVDVPAPGCWVFQLSWGTHRDVIALPYAVG
jgi:hypothetical protein